MISLQQLQKIFLTIALVVVLTPIITFSESATNSWAIASLTQPSSQTPIQIAAMNRTEAMTKNIEGKAQEAIGNMTGNPKDQMMGKAKQVEGQTRNVVEDLKDKVKLRGRTKAVAKNLEGKVQAAKGKASGNRKDQFAGNAKQIESEARNAVEDVKNAVRDNPQLNIN